ncbi:hypothetical protein [Candidatus Chloroploca sp. Khr17]|uniref:hypothetical protein n=1 Tax=Candidatus Chloroploca sp. Khr17 TaxID=2496869 RepID=UPI00101BA9A5|nr:hypothetical protein [Candidatus Chloroploca sp. Khr17]
MPSTSRSQQRRRQPIRSPQQRRPGPTTVARHHASAPDYTQDYMYVRRDLRLIAILSSVLFFGMVAVSFVI